MDGAGSRRIRAGPGSHKIVHEGVGGSRRPSSLRRQSGVGHGSPRESLTSRIGSGHLASTARGRGETGRRSRLKICFPTGSAGSSPAVRTSPKWRFVANYIAMRLSPKRQNLWICRFADPAGFPQISVVSAWLPGSPPETDEVRALDGNLAWKFAMEGWTKPPCT